MAPLNPFHTRINKVVRLVVCAPSEKDGEVKVDKDYDNGGMVMGHIHHAGTHLLRIEKHGTAVTFSVTADFKGKLDPTFEKSFPDIRGFQRGLKDGETFIIMGGGGTFKQVGLAITKP